MRTNQIIIDNAVVKGNTIHYTVSEIGNLGLLQQDQVELFVRYQGSENVDWGLNQVPQSILLVSISLYLLPLTWFYNVELVVPEMDKVLYDNLPSIYKAYSKIYGPFEESWGGKVSVGKIVQNKSIRDPKYNKIVFFSGGVDACHAGINNPGPRTLLVNIPDIESKAQNEGLLREEKFSLIKNFSKDVHSDWLLISNNFNLALLDSSKIQSFLEVERKLSSAAFHFDGFHGIRYIFNMCCCAPIAYHFGVRKLIMGSGFEQLEDKSFINQDGANPELSDSISFADVRFTEQDGSTTRRSEKVRNIIDWCKIHQIRTKLWVCFEDRNTQCGFCPKCVRTQLNILCAGENPKDWGFDNFSERKFTKFIKSYHYQDGNPCWLWDNIDTIDQNKRYPYCNDLLHWLKDVGYRDYILRFTPPLIAKDCSLGAFVAFANIRIISKQL